MSALKNIYRRMKDILGRQRNALLARIGLFNGFYRRARGCRMIVYHGICEKQPLRFNTLFITRKTFEKHLRIYRKYCNLISLDDYYQQNFNPDKFNICISFDDGFAGAYRHALPLLEKHRVPAAFFITAIRDTGADILWNDFLSLVYATGPDTIQLGQTSFLKRKGRYRERGKGISLNDHLRTLGFAEKQAWMESMRAYATFRNDLSLQDHWLQMRIEEIKTLADSPLITIGSHGYYHNDLALDDQGSLRFELDQSKHFLETVTGRSIRSLAFPYGSYSPEVIDQAKRSGYQQLLATEFLFPGHEHEPALRERMGVNPFINATTQLRAIIKGNYA